MNCDCTETERRQHSEIEDLQAEIARLRLAIRRLADQDATLSVCDGAVTVTMDATLTDAEREAVAKAVKDYEDSASTFYERSMHAAARIGMKQAVVMRGLLERLGGEG